VPALLQAIAAVAVQTRTNSVLRAVVIAATELVDADYGAFVVLGSGADGVPIAGVDRVEVTAYQRDRSAGVHTRRIEHVSERVGMLARLIGVADAIRLDDLTSHAACIDFSSRHPQMRALLGMPIHVGGQLCGVLYLTRMADRPSFTGDDELEAKTLGTHAGLAIVNARSFEAGRLREESLRSLAVLAAGLSAGLELADVLPTVIRQARDIVDADFAAVALPSDDPAMLTMLYGDGVDAAHLIGSKVPTETSLTGRVMRSGAMTEVGNLRTEPGLSVSHELRLLFGPAIFIPVGPPTAVRGVLVAFNRSGRPAFDREAVSLLHAFAAQVAVSLELAEHRTGDTRLAVVEDRERIARDLHDVVIQRLFAIGLTLEGASHSISELDAGTQVSRAIDELDQTIKEIRTTIFGLQGAVGANGTDQASLRARIVAVAEQAVPALGFIPSLRFDGLIDTTVPDRLADQVVAVLREALSNAARHAHASHVDVVLAVSRDTVTLSVDDDGVGITGTGRRSGLRNMEVRAKASGGKLLLVDRAPSGTHIEWEVPMRGPHPFKAPSAGA
jgi:signal transduction histidine kinase